MKSKSVMNLFTVFAMVFTVFLASVNACSEVGEPCGLVSLWDADYRVCCGGGRYACSSHTIFGSGICIDCHTQDCHHGPEYPCCLAGP